MSLKKWQNTLNILKAGFENEQTSHKLTFLPHDEPSRHMIGFVVFCEKCDCSTLVQVDLQAIKNRSKEEIESFYLSSARRILSYPSCDELELLCDIHETDMTPIHEEIILRK